MLNILRTDIYKAIRTASFWVTLGLTIVSSMISSFVLFKVFSLIVGSPEFDIGLELEQGASLPNFFQSVSEVMPECLFLIGIFAVMFAISDFSHGTIKNIASKGYHREYIYLSKFVTTLIYAVLSLALTFVTSFITAQIVINDSVPNFFDYNNDFAKELGYLSLQIVTYIAMAIFLATLIRSLGPALSVFLGFFFLQSTVVDLINKFIHEILKSEFSITPYTISGAFSNPDHITQGVIVLCAYTLVFTVVGLYAFRKRDIN